MSALDLHSEGIENAQASAAALRYEGRADFRQGDAAEHLPFEESSFDAVMLPAHGGSAPGAAAGGRLNELHRDARAPRDCEAKRAVAIARLSAAVFAGGALPARALR